jgi:hypothetical protein
MISLFKFLQRKLIAASHALQRRRASRFERYLNQAVDHADLKRRMRLAEAWERRFP